MQALVLNHGGRRGAVFDPEYPDPRPARGEVLVRVHLAGICATDLELARGYMGFSGVPGHEFVGTIMGGSRARLGERIVADINCSCCRCDLCRDGLVTHCRRRTVLGILKRDGAFAQRLVVPLRNCHVVPSSVSDEQAVFVEPLAAAVHVLREHDFARRTRAMVLGAGRLGLLCAQVLKLQKCKLRVVGRSSSSLRLCDTLGLPAAPVDSVRAAADQDVVVDCTGTPDGLALALRLVRPCGTIILKSTYARPKPLALAPIVIDEVRVVGSRCGAFPPAIELLRRRRVNVEALISGEYPLARGAAALSVAAQPGTVKVLLRPDPS